VRAKKKTFKNKTLEKGKGKKTVNAKEKKKTPQKTPAAGRKGPQKGWVRRLQIERRQKESEKFRECRLTDQSGEKKKKKKKNSGLLYVET